MKDIRYEIGDLFATKSPFKHDIGYLTSIKGGFYNILWFGSGGYNCKGSYIYDELTRMCVKTHNHYSVVK